MHAGAITPPGRTRGSDGRRPAPRVVAALARGHAPTADDCQPVRAMRLLPTTPRILPDSLQFLRFHALLLL